MKNVVCLTTKRNEQTESPRETNEADNFISDFYDWAMKNGIDTTTIEFKWDAATVLTIVRGLLHKSK